MRVLVTWGSKRGGTAGIGRLLSDALVAHGVEVVAVPAGEVNGLGTFGAVIGGGALYANCRQPTATGFPASAMAKKRSGDWRIAKWSAVHAGKPHADTRRRQGRSTQAQRWA